MKQIFHVALASSMLLMIGCATIVKQPAANQVKTIAIIGVTSNSTPHAIGQSGGGLSALAGLAGAASKNKDGEKANFGGTRLVDLALEKYTKGLSEVPGWHAVSKDQVVKKPVYREFIESASVSTKTPMGGALNALVNMATVTPKDMPYYNFDSNAQTQQRKAMGELAKSLGVDAVAVVAIDIGYVANFAIGGTGTAKASVATSIHVVDKNGEWAVNMLTPKKDGGMRETSDETTAMIGGNILFTDAVEKMYSNAISKSVDHNLSLIKKEKKS